MSRFANFKERAEYSDFAATAKSDKSPDVRSILPDSSSPSQQVTRLFKYQSYFDSTLLEKAILSQPRNNPIVPSTLQEQQTPGYSIGLHPSSQTPIALQFRVGGQPTSSQPIILAPGQIVRPHGLPLGMKSGSFSGFAWGLPFGWLGGGVATLVVNPSPDAELSWNGGAEVIFHRTRMVIKSVAAIPADAPKNWPTMFPWLQAVQGSASIGQQGAAQISIGRPTKTLMRLNVASLGNPTTMRIILQETDDLDTDSAGALIAAQASFYDHTWDQFASFGAAGNIKSQSPVVILPHDNPVTRLAASNGGVTLLDINGGFVAETTVDIVRYGIL